LIAERRDRYPGITQQTFQLGCRQRIGELAVDHRPKGRYPALFPRQRQRITAGEQANPPPLCTIKKSRSRPENRPAAIIADKERLGGCFLEKPADQLPSFPQPFADAPG